MYKCRVPDCDRAKRGAKSTAYKEFVFHCYQTHGLMKTALEESMEMATTEAKKQKFRQLIAAVVKDGQEHPEIIPEPSVEEIHVCLICNGINRDTRKENKEAKTLRYNICITRFELLWQGYFVNTEIIISYQCLNSSDGQFFSLEACSSSICCFSFFNFRKINFLKRPL